MTATAADVAKYTSDGVVITVQSTTVLANYPDADDQGDSELEMFFVSAADSLVVLNERFNLLSAVDTLKEAVVVEESLGLGSTITLTPTVPCVRTIDEDREIDRTLRLRAYAYEAASDKYSVELMT